MSAARAIHRLAIANRGEAALRCIRAVKALRATTGEPLLALALYTAPERVAPFVRHADAAAELPVVADAPGGARAAYLDHEVLLDGLRRLRADAVWPGWGFVAEDPVFAERCAEAGIVFLGPPPDVMRTLGDKIAAKRLAEGLGVPVTPWSGGPLPGADAARAAGDELGWPVVLKAAAGGGGRGIRVVAGPEAMTDAFRGARDEAASAFGDERLFAEQLVAGGRHVEVQIAADRYGQVLSLGCRDCSVQRRHQKLLEETPPPGLAPGVQEELESAAVTLAAKVGYVGVGTVEFLVRGRGREIAFLEVNPRLQVEHGITEAVTGADLVQLQIRIARGERLPERGWPRRGYAMEARLCAEDPDAGFRPAPGRVVRFDPALGPGVRVDTGVVAGSQVPAEFDSLVAKLIAWGETREEARARLCCALADTEVVIEGGATNRGLLIELLEDPAVRAGGVDTTWLDRRPRSDQDDQAAAALVAAAILAYQRTRRQARRNFFADPGGVGAARLPASEGQEIDLVHRGTAYKLRVYAIGSWKYRVHLAGRVVTARLVEEAAGGARLELGGRALRVLHDVEDAGMRLEVEGRPHRFEGQAAGHVRAGMPAMVVAVQVEPGERVEAGRSVAILEAMKTEIGVEAPISGVVTEVAVRRGQQVAAGDVLLVIEAEGEATESAPVAAPLSLPREEDPLALFFAADGAVDLAAVDAADPARRQAAVSAVGEQIRRVLLGYDADPERVRRLRTLLDAPLPPGLSPGLCAQLALVRRDVVAFADVEQPFVRSGRGSVSGEDGPSNAERARMYARRLRAGGAGIDPDFLALMRRAFAHYGVRSLDPDETLERAALRLFASQRAPAARHVLVMGMLHRLGALARAGTPLGRDDELRDALLRIAAMRGQVPDTLADAATELRHALFDAPALETRLAASTRALEERLEAAGARTAAIPQPLLLELADAPRRLFDRVGRLVASRDPARRAVALGAHLRRLYTPWVPESHAAQDVAGEPGELLVLPDGRIVLGAAVGPGVERAEGGTAGAEGARWAEHAPSDPEEGPVFRDTASARPRVEHALEVLRALAGLAAAARASDGSRGVDALELVLPAAEAAVREALEAEILAAGAGTGSLGALPALPAGRLTVTWVGADGQGDVHRTFVPAGDEPGRRLRPARELHGLHPETAARVDLARLARFELERLPGDEDVYAFFARSREVARDERIFVLAEVRGRAGSGQEGQDGEGAVELAAAGRPADADDAGADADRGGPGAGGSRVEVDPAERHVPAFERAFAAAARTLRAARIARDERRRLDWNRIAVFVGPEVALRPATAERLARDLFPETRHLGLDKVVVRLRARDPEALERQAREVEVAISDPTGHRMEIAWRAPRPGPLAPVNDYERRVAEARRRGLVHPYEIVRMLTRGAPEVGLPAGTFEEHDLDPAAPEPRAVPVAHRPYGRNAAGVVFGVLSTPTELVPEGLRRVLVLSDPTRELGALGAPECDRLLAAFDLAEALRLPVEWVPVSGGARISMESGTENLDATARVARRIITFTRSGGVVHVIVHGVNVGAQSYFDALATMGLHTRGALVMTPGGSMVLTGRAALEASGGVSAEDEGAIGGYERVMGPNGEAHYPAADLADAFRVLQAHYRTSYVVPGETGPRRRASADPAERDVGDAPWDPAEDDGLASVGELFDPVVNPGRKRPFAMRSLMRAVVDADGGWLERWPGWAGAETAIVWDAFLGGWPVCLVGIESRAVARRGYRPADGPESWTGGTLFPLSSKKMARALNAASGVRPAVVLANLSGFDGSPESMRKLQLEYGAEIARAVVGFEGPLLFLVVSRYHGGAYVVFSRALNPELRAAALEGSFASVIGGGPAAAVVFGREARARALADPRVAGLAGELRERALREVVLEKQAEIAAEFDAVHTVERALRVGSLERLVPPTHLRPYLIETLNKGGRS